MQKKINFLRGTLLTGVAFAAVLNVAMAADKPAMEHSTMHQGETTPNAFWWPNQLDLAPLRKNVAASDPLGQDFDYAKAFESLDLDTLKQDLQVLMKTSQDWWPADYGHYGPLFVRMAWHSAGTYRNIDGRGGADGGMQRFAPLNSWPDNVNLDKARRLLWPIKQKYGDKISWGDLIILAGTVAMEDMGFKTLGFAGGRVDAWEPDNVDWGPESKWLAHDRQTTKGKLKGPLAATQMGLIYVNPEGPGGNPDPWEAAKAVREAFGRMAMNDEETVALIAGGHTFGKTHGAADPSKYVGPEPEAAGVEEQGLGWKSSYGTGNGADTISSGLEGAWTVSPAEWTHNFLQNLFTYNWIKSKSPAGATQWIPDDNSAASIVPDAHDPDKFHAPIMLTTDLALKFDPEYRKIAKGFYENPQTFERAYAKAWFKLTHRDMGPPSRYLGALAPKEQFIWQDPIPAIDYKLVDAEDVTALKKDILRTGLSVPELIRTAWASASSYRDTDMRGGANGARLRLAPQKDWDANTPAELANVLKSLEKVQKRFNRAQKDGTEISLADLIVLGGAAALETAAHDAGHDVQVPFTPGRTDASQAQTDVASMAVLELGADGFRNYFADTNTRSPAEMLIEKASLLRLSIPEMVVLVGGMRTLNANAGQVSHGVFTNQPGQLSNDFFDNLLDSSTQWRKADNAQGIYEGHDRKTGKVKWTATPVDLIIGSNSELRAVAEVYAFEGSEDKFSKDFVEAWVKVMNLGRF